MLSTNISVSLPVRSRKYSAMVRAERATRRRAPGRLVPLPNPHARLLDALAAGFPNLGSLLFDPQAGPFAGSLAHAGKPRKTAVRAGPPGDQLLQNDGLAKTGPAE